MTDPGNVVIIGAGPTGLGAAYRLQELGVESYTLVEGHAGPGGLAASIVDDHGFTWDIGGHVQFSHYSYYDDVLDRAVTCGWLEHERESWVWIKKRWVPYPFQYNIHRLPPEDCDDALRGLQQAANRTDASPPENFRQWIEQTFGRGLADIFLLPYNFKVWGYPLERLDINWMGQRVAVPDVDRIWRNVSENRDDVSWGPNNRFRFPLHGGTGAIWTYVAGLIPQDRQRYLSWVESIDLDGRTLRLRDGDTVRYDHLISTMPLDRLCERCEGIDGAAAKAASSLVHSSVHVLGIGLRGGRPETLRKKCWMYFPESHSPYYRVTVFSNYSPNNAPSGEGYWSLMAEVCESPSKPVEAAGLRDWTLEALRQDGLIGERSELISFWHHREEHGYPTPSLGRDEALGVALSHLNRRRVYSRGRFGAWKYEVSNQDHSFMQGVEAVNRILGIGDEPTVERPAYANSGVFLRTENESR
jgi:protoporphyrinogen oxidase